MGAKINYIEFINKTDKILENYFKNFGENICCKKGCSECCEKGDYPLSDIELNYLISGFTKLDTPIKTQIRENIKNMEKGGKCPFLIHHECSVYQYRPIICRVHGLAYIYKGEKVKIPHCANSGKNFSNAFINGTFYGNPIPTNLDTPSLLEGSYSEIKNLYDWLHQ